MIWVAPSEKDAANEVLEKRLWAAADQLRANSGLTSAQYSQPVLGLIFLRFAEVRFAAQRAKLEKASASSRRGSRLDDPTAYKAQGSTPFISNTALAGIQLVFPGDTLAERFCFLVKPLRLQQVTLEKQAANLRRTRDLLLPRLLSGQVAMEPVGAAESTA